MRVKIIAQGNHGSFYRGLTRQMHYPLSSPILIAMRLMLCIQSTKIRSQCERVLSSSSFNQSPFAFTRWTFNTLYLNLNNAQFLNQWKGARELKQTNTCGRGYNNFFCYTKQASVRGWSDLCV